MSLPPVKACSRSTTLHALHWYLRRLVVGPLAGAGPLRLLFCLCLALMLASLLFPARASAWTSSPAETTAGPPTLQMAVGFDDDARLDYWLPAWITLSNDGPDFSGTLSATTYASALPSGAIVAGILPWSYKEPVTLPHGTQKQVNIYVPFYETPMLPRGILVALSDSHGKVIAAQRATPFTLSPGSLLVGILSDLPPQSEGFSSLNTVSLPDPTRSIELASLDASTLPDMAEVLANFDAIVLDDFSTARLTAAQLSALQTWVNQGGALIEVGGPQWQRTLAALPPQLVPVVIHGTAILPAGANLLPAGGPALGARFNVPSITISAAPLPGKDDARQQAFSNFETVLASGDTPLIVQAHQGQGSICYLAFDPAAAPLASWPGTIPLWKALLVRSLGDQALLPNVVPRYSNGPGEFILRGGLSHILQPGTGLPLKALVLLLLGYLVLIGPVRFLIVRRLHRPTWSWRIVLSGVILFSLLTYAVAYTQKGTSVNSISIIQLNQGGQFAHVTTFFSVFIPSQPGAGGSRLAIPARTLTQPLAQEPFQSDSRIVGNDYRAVFTLGQNETNVTLPDVGAWSVHALVSEGDQKLHGGLLAHLALRNGSLVGTVTNTLESSLSDVYILMPYSIAYIGHLPSGQTQQVDVPVHSSTPDALNRVPAGSTLADQIARDNHLPVPYFPYATGAQPQNDFQRHLAILSALSGEGYAYLPCNGPCSTHALVNRHTITTPAFGTPAVNPIDASDPLLVGGAPATLIGWADQPLEAAHDVTIDGASPGGTHESLVQLPLNIGFSGQLTLPPGLIPGQVTDAQGAGVGIVSPAIYTMKTGSITFEFTLPSVDTAQVNSLTITESFIGQPGVPTGTRVRLYNWVTSSWDTIALNNHAFTTANTRAYTNTDGRILLQVANQNATLGTLLFSKPLLGLSAAFGRLL